MWTGYFLIDFNDSMSDENFTKAKQCVNELGTTSSVFPNKITRSRYSITGKKIICTLEKDNKITYKNVVDALASSCGVTTTQVETMIDNFKTFDHNKSCVAYMNTEWDDWNE